jgi:uncharacterized membrane protein
MTETKRTKEFEELKLIASKASSDAENAQRKIRIIEQRNEDFIERIKQISSQAFNESKKAQKDNEEIKKEQKNVPFKIIEILTIFVAVISFLFGGFQFISNLNFLESAGLLLLLGLILGGFILLTYWLFSIKER